MNWQSLVRGVAPVLGTALGGPAGGVAVKFLAEKFLGDPDATESQLADAVMTASPDKLLELKKLDQDFSVKLRELDLDLEKLAIGDRQNARELFKVNVWPQIGLSTVYIVGYFVVLSAVLTGSANIDQANQSLVNVLIGVLTGAVPMILQFWFGSSLGSKEKDRKVLNEK